MNIQQCQIIAPWKLESVQTNFGWKQVCNLTNCQVKSRSNFQLVSTQNNIKVCVCSDCASRLTGLDISKLSIVDTYIDKVKPFFKSLKSLNGLQPVNDLNRPYYVSKLIKIIGDQRIFISIFNNNQCMLIINDKQIFPNLDKAFKNTSAVIEFAIEYVNNQYKTKLFNYIIYGQHFVMP
jgi:hypothetical protein